MPAYDYDALVSVPGPELTALRAELVNASGTVAAPVLAEAFTRLADAGLPVNNRFLASVSWVREWASGTTYAALHGAAEAVLNTATGLP